MTIPQVLISLLAVGGLIVAVSRVLAMTGEGQQDHDPLVLDPDDPAMRPAVSELVSELATFMDLYAFLPGTMATMSFAISGPDYRKGMVILSSLNSAGSDPCVVAAEICECRQCLEHFRSDPYSHFHEMISGLERQLIVRPDILTDPIVFNAAKDSGRFDPSNN